MTKNNITVGDVFSYEEDIDAVDYYIVRSKSITDNLLFAEDVLDESITVSSAQLSMDKDYKYVGNTKDPDVLNIINNIIVDSAKVKDEDRVELTLKEWDLFQDLAQEDEESLYGALRNMFNKDKYYALRDRFVLDQETFSMLWFNYKNNLDSKFNEDMVKIIPEKTWVVENVKIKDQTDLRFLVLTGRNSIVFTFLSNATHFDTEAEAKLWETPYLKASLVTPEGTLD